MPTVGKAAFTPDSHQEQLITLRLRLHASHVTETRSVQSTGVIQNPNAFGYTIFKRKQPPSVITLQSQSEMYVSSKLSSQTKNRQHHHYFAEELFQRRISNTFIFPNLGLGGCQVAKYEPCPNKPAQH